MPTIVIDGKLFISLNEVLNFMTDFLNDMENKREECLDDIKKAKLQKYLEEASINLTNMDYDMFRDSLKTNIFAYKKRLEEKYKELLSSEGIDADYEQALSDKEVRK